MKIPFIAENSAVFECQSGRLCVGDLVNNPATYEIPVKGICHLPAEAITSVSEDCEGSFGVDLAQIFLIDAEQYERVSDQIGEREMVMPDIDWLDKLRGRTGTAFGYVSSSDLHDCDFSAGDGTYVIDPGRVKAGLPVPTETPPSRAKELLRRIASSMNTILCAKCFSQEIMEHPELGRFPADNKRKKAWAAKMAEYAVAQGWTAIAEKCEFGEATPICPHCRKALPKGQ